MSQTYKQRHDFAAREAEALKMRTKYPTRFPVIVERYSGSNDAEIANIDKNKFLIPEEMTVGQFMFIVRKRIALDEHQAFFMFVESVKKDGKKSQILAKSSDSIHSLYQAYRDQDNFLYFVYTSQNAFGAI
eukprot:m.132688 g.132688  ORF g.132688 m.132688 type:complete len:131 (-) comp29627_c1_seq1:45-437(-)